MGDFVDCYLLVDVGIMPARIIRQYDRAADAAAGLNLIRSGMPEADVIAYVHGKCPETANTGLPRRAQGRGRIAAALRALHALEPCIIADMDDA